MVFHRKRQIRSATRQANLRDERLSTRDVFSYHANRSISSVSRGREETTSSPVRDRNTARPFWHLLPGLFALAAIISCAIYASLLNTTPRIHVASVSDPEALLLRPTDEYSQGAEALLRSSLLNRNKITVNTEQLNQRMSAMFPELSEVNFVLPFIGQRIVVELHASQPAMILKTAQGKSYLIDNSGRVLLNSNETTKQNLAKGLPVVKDESNLPIEQGKNILPKQSVEFLTTVYNQLNSKGVAIESMTLPPQPNRLHVKLGGKPYYLKFSLLMDPKQASGNALAVLHEFDAKHIVPSQYVDLRIEERVFYL